MVLKVNFRRQTRVQNDDKIRRDGIREYFNHKLKKRRADGSYATLFDRSNGGWKCNWLFAKIYKCLLRRLSGDFIPGIQTMLAMENIIQIDKHVEYEYERLRFSDGFVPLNAIQISCPY